MKKIAILGGLLAIVAALGAATLNTSAQAEDDGTEKIRIVERPGYFETHGNIFNRAAGKVVFEVDNKSGKDAGFVLTQPGRDPLVIGIKNGESGRLEVDLKPGSYEYYCPIIPTAKYPLTVQ